MKHSVWVNRSHHGHLDPQDRGFNYGDGVFTTLSIVKSAPVWLDAHIQRLKQDCESLFISNVNWHQVESDIISVCQEQDFGVVKIVVSRGVGERGYRFSGDETPTVVISVFPQSAPSPLKQPLKLAISHVRCTLSSHLAGIKHLNRLENVLAKQEAAHRDVDDCLMRSYEGHLIETTSANIYFIKNETVYTPKIDRSGVNGVVRRKIRSFIDVSKWHEEDIDWQSWSTKKPIGFVSNCVWGVVPVHSIGNTVLSDAKASPLYNDIYKHIMGQLRPDG